MPPCSEVVPSCGPAHHMDGIQDIHRINQLCAALFMADSNARTQAEQELAPLCRVEQIPTLRCIMETSGEGMSHYFVAAALVRLISESWSALWMELRLELQQWLLRMIASKGMLMESHSVNATLLALCRLTKLGWLDHDAHKQVPAHVHQHFLQSPALTPMGLRILCNLVEEMNQMGQRLTLSQHRKVLVSFRDSCLMDIFQTALRLLDLTLKSKPPV